MTPRTKRISISVAALVGALLAVGGWAAKAAPTVAHAIDTRYVHTDTFAIYQQGEASKRALDSAEHVSEVRRIDTALAALYRACQHRKECP